MVPHRTHDFDGLKFAGEPTVDELLDLLERLDAEFEAQRLRLMQVLEWFELAVTEQVAAERHGDELAGRLAAAEAQLGRVATELAALEGTKLFRAARPVRRVYARVRRVRG